jgi:hypothetical protein
MSELDHNTLRELLDYNPDTGEFTWRIRAAYWLGVGSRAGSVNGKGYRIIGMRGRYYSEHRLAWFYTHGVWPTHEVDHINRVRTDNRLANLRDVPSHVNYVNRTPRKLKPRPARLPSPYVGVQHTGYKWRADVWHEGRNVYIGAFNTPEEARDAYLEAKRKLQTQKSPARG